jgi:hypothetical protein
VAVGDVVSAGTPVGDGDGTGVAVVGVGAGVAAGGVLAGAVDGVTDGLLAGVVAGVVAGAVLCAGTTRFGVVTAWWLGVKSSAATAITTPSTATRPPVAAPAVNADRSRLNSLVRRSRSHFGSAARRAAQLLNGAAAMPSVGNSSSAASSGPLSWVARVSAAAIPAKPSSASVDSAQFARRASHHLAASLVFGVRRKAAFRANRPSTEARATTSDVDCQMKKAPSASRQDAPVPRRSSATARTRPSTTSTGTVATRKVVSLRNSSPPPRARLAAPVGRKTRKMIPSRSPYHCSPPARYAHRCAMVR